MEHNNYTEVAGNVMQRLNNSTTTIINNNLIIYRSQRIEPLPMNPFRSSIIDEEQNFNAYMDYKLLRPGYNGYWYDLGHWLMKNQLIHHERFGENYAQKAKHLRYLWHPKIMTILKDNLLKDIVNLVNEYY